MYEVFVQRDDGRSLDLSDGNNNVAHSGRGFTNSSIYTATRSVRVFGEHVLKPDLSQSQPSICLTCGQGHNNDVNILGAVAVKVAEDPAVVVQYLTERGFGKEEYPHIMLAVNAYRSAIGFKQVMGRTAAVNCHQSEKEIGDAIDTAVHERDGWWSIAWSVFYASIPIWGRHNDTPVLMDTEPNLIEYLKDNGQLQVAAMWQVAKQVFKMYDNDRVNPTEFVVRLWAELADFATMSEEESQRTQHMDIEEHYDEEFNEEVGDQGVMPRVKFVTYPRVVPFLGKAGSKAYRPADAGMYPRYMDRWTMDKRVFSRKKHTDGVDAAIMIDCSGSMRLDLEKLRGLMYKFPGADIFGYTGRSGEGLITRFAGDGKAIEDHSITHFLKSGGGNDIDLESIQYLFHVGKARTKLWVSDGQVCGGPLDRDQLNDAIESFVTEADDGRFFHIHSELLNEWDQPLNLYLKEKMYSPEPRRVKLNGHRFYLERARI